MGNIFLENWNVYFLRLLESNVYEKCQSSEEKFSIIILTLQLNRG